MTTQCVTWFVGQCLKKIRRVNKNLQNPKTSLFRFFYIFFILIFINFGPGCIGLCSDHAQEGVNAQCSSDAPNETRATSGVSDQAGIGVTTEGGSDTAKHKNIQNNGDNREKVAIVSADAPRHGSICELTQRRLVCWAHSPGHGVVKV